MRRLGEGPDVPAGNWSDGLPWRPPELAELPELIKSAECTKAPRPRLGGGSADELEGRLAVRLTTDQRAVQEAQSKELIKAGMCHIGDQPADARAGAALRHRFPNCALHGDLTAIVQCMPPMQIVLPST